MRSLIFMILCLGLASGSYAQQKVVYTIPADSVKLSYCDSSELIIENHTQNVPGFLFNTGKGRTIFKRGAQSLGNGSYLIGGDTLNLASNAWVQGGNAFGMTGVLGTRDSNHLDFYTYNKFQGRLTATGNLLLGTNSDDQGSKLQVTSNLAVSGAVIANFRALTTSPGTSSIIGTNSYLGAGFNGVASLGLQAGTVGSGTWPIDLADTFVVPCGNCGGYLFAIGSTSGANIGVAGEAINASTNVGILGKATKAQSSAKNIGVQGNALNSGPGSIMIGGFFGTFPSVSSPYLESAALIADNGPSTNPIFLGRKNGTKVFKIDSTGTSLTHLIGYTATPTISAGPGAGTSPTVTISGTDLSGTITLTTGASPSANSTILTVTFSSAFVSAPRKFLQATNAATIGLAGNGPIPSTTTTTLVLTSQAALTANTTYTWDYMLVQ